MREVNFFFESLKNINKTVQTGMSKKSSGKYFAMVTAGTITAYFCFWWLFRLDILPGLHGDEAWAGLKAHDYQLSGIDQLSGMTPYTGILQNLMAELSFKFFGVGVFQLRLPGTVANLISLVIIAITFRRCAAYKESAIFLLLIASSALFLTSARVAWEVNSLTLLFISLSFLSIVEISRGNPHFHMIWVCLFFTANVFGTYNHVIFSCIPVSAFCGLVLWSNYCKSADYKDLLVLLAVNFFNVCLAFVLMRYQLNFIHQHIYYFPLIFIAFLSIQYKAYNRLKIVNWAYMQLIPPVVIQYLLALFVLGFAYTHGKAFFEMLGAYSVILQLYSYESSLTFKIGYILCSATFLLYLLRYIIADLADSKNAAPVFFILSYLGIFNLYTMKCSFRYYLGIIAILSIYLAFKLASERFGRKPFFLSQLTLLILLNAQLLDIFINNPIAVKAVDFKIGNGQTETSAHFLPKEPLIDFLKKENISNINYQTDPYFIDQPVRFYKLVAPWKELPSNTATVDYDYIKYKSGFFYLKDK